MEFYRKIALVGGGTAGHITPNIALIPELKKRNYDIIYIGSKNGMEKDIIPKYDIPFFGITTDKLRRYFDIKNLFIPINLIKGINEAYSILKKEKVDIIFSKGGYVAVPVIIAAKMLKIPVISHEADLTPGLANKIATPHSKIICCNFEETAKMFGKKGFHTGSPIRQDILNGNREKGQKLLSFKTNKPIILVTGGSLGSRYINNLIRSNLTKLLKEYNIVHQCGNGNIDSSISYDGYKQYEIISENLADIFAASDFVISRSGANIIFELLSLKKPNLLIPLSKKASRGDQILNANIFEKKGYSIVLTEEEATEYPNHFFEKLQQLDIHREEYIDTMKKSKEIDAINIICDLIDKT